MHIIIASRSEPPLLLGRARMYGELNELRADDLRLRREEIERFLSKSVGVTLSTEQQSLLQRSEASRDVRAYARILAEAMNGDSDEQERFGGLSKREYEVLQLMAAGMPNQEIAETLIIEISTAKVHVRHVCQKLGVQNRLQAVAKAREKGLLKEKGDAML